MTRTQTLCCGVISTAVFTSLVLAGCSPNRSPSAQSQNPTTEQATTVKDLEAQLTRQFREQWGEQVSGVRIEEFAPCAVQVTATVRIIIDIRWVSPPGDTHIRSLGTGIMLYRAANDYLVGTLKLENREHLSARLKDKASVNVILKFR